jgi:hypothetical protein
MENYCRGLLLGMVAGACIGMVVVARNKKLSKKINEGYEMAMDKAEDIKEFIEEKKDESECFSGSNEGCCDFESYEKDDKKNFYKKPKNK